MDSKRVALLLGREFAQHDRNFLHYSVAREDVLSRLRDMANSFLIINAPRGSGKSGLLLLLETELKTLSASTSRVIKKYYGDVKFPATAMDIDAYVQFWRTAMLEWIIIELGVEIETPETSDELYAVELSERSGRREGRPSHTRPKEEHPERSYAGGATDLPAIVMRLLAKTGLRFWLLLDEMDDLYSNTAARNNALVGLFQASDGIAHLSDYIFVRLTIRPHIYTHLKTTFDVIQKFRGNELSVYWSEVQLREILVKRIQFFDHRTGNEQQSFELTAPSQDRQQPQREACQIISRYFEDFDLSFGDGKGSDYRALHTISLRRPRWMLEYCAIALSSARADFVDTAEFRRAMHEYGRNRLQFLAGEHNAQLPHLMAWVNGLAAARRVNLGTSENLRELLVQHIVREDSSPVGEGPADLRESNAALEIAQALYMVEILRAKQSMGGKDDHRFYTYRDSPELLTSWNTRANTVWEMHPTFARALNVIDNLTFRVGGEVRILGEKREGRSDIHKRKRGRWRRGKPAGGSPKAPDG